MSNTIPVSQRISSHFALFVDSIIEILPMDSAGIIDLQSLQSNTLCDILGGLKDLNDTVQSFEELQVASNQAD